MINVDKLKGKIAENRLTLADYARSLGISTATLHRKLADGGVKISVAQMHKTVDVLNLTKEEAISIFLPANSH